MPTIHEPRPRFIRSVESGHVVYVVEVQPPEDDNYHWQMRQGYEPTSSLDEALKIEAYWNTIAPSWKTRIAKFLRMPDDAAP